MIDNKGLRLLEKTDTKHFETKHLVARKQMDFCSQACAKEYLSESLTRFIIELAPMEDRKREDDILGC